MNYFGRGTRLPVMNDAGSANPLSDQTAILMIEFLDRELDLTETLLGVARMEMDDGSPAHGSEAYGRAQRGLQTIRKFVWRVPDSDAQSRILDRFEKIEAQAAELRATNNLIGRIPKQAK